MYSDMAVSRAGWSFLNTWLADILILFSPLSLYLSLLHNTFGGKSGPGSHELKH